MPGARFFLFAGAVLAALGVAAGAFAAHALKERLSPEMLTVFETGTRYHLLHALGLLGVGLAGLHLQSQRWLVASGWTMLAGLVVFSGTLYALAAGGPRWLGAITPVGGTALIAAWALMAVAVWRG